MARRRRNTPDGRLLRSLNRNITRLAHRLEADNVAAFVALSQRPFRMVWLNLLAGISRGLGFVLGAGAVATVLTILAAWTTYHLLELSDMVPWFGELASSVKRFAEEFVGKYGGGG